MWRPGDLARSERPSFRLFARNSTRIPNGWPIAKAGPEAGRVLGEDAASVDEVVSVPAVPHPHDRDASSGARGVQRPPVADERVDMVDSTVTVPVVEHQVPGLQLIERHVSYPRHICRAAFREDPACVGTGRGHVPGRAVVRTDEPPGEPGAIEPGYWLAPQRRRLLRRQPPFAGVHIRIPDESDPPLHDRLRVWRQRRELDV